MAVSMWLASRSRCAWRAAGPAAFGSAPVRQCEAGVNCRTLERQQRRGEARRAMVGVCSGDLPSPRGPPGQLRVVQPLEAVVGQRVCGLRRPNARYDFLRFYDGILMKMD